jgi:fucokinase
MEGYLMGSGFKGFNESYKPYDICVITAANEYQAQGYREQIKWRTEKGGLPSETEFIVIADPHGKRIGSGGSTIYVLYNLLNQICQINKDIVYNSVTEALKSKRILILHSGGDSRRLPAYSAIGKIFIPLPTSFTSSFRKDNGLDGFVALFDLLLNNLMQLPYLDDGQVVIASGDVLLSFDASKVIFSDSGVTGLAYPDSIDVASKHGVYIATPSATEESLRKVMDFLQKPTYKELKESNALDIEERAFTDTGIMNFSTGSIETLMQATGVHIEDGKIVAEKNSFYDEITNAQVYLDIYQEFPFAMLGKPVKDGTLPTRNHIDNIQRFCSVLYESAVNGNLFYVCLLSYCEFFHIGTSKQLIQNFHNNNYTLLTYGFQNFNKAKVPNKSGLGKAFIYNSLIDTNSLKAKGTSFIEGCYLEGEVLLEGENILTGIPKGVGNITLQKGICLVTKIERISSSVKENGWVSIVYGIEDDFKKLAGDDTATFLNRPFIRWIKDKGIATTDLWEDNEPHDLWNARLFPFGTDHVNSICVSLSFQSNSIFQLDKWGMLPRMSLQDVLRTVDYERLLKGYSTLNLEIR